MTITKQQEECNNFAVYAQVRFHEIAQQLYANHPSILYQAKNNKLYK